MCWCVKACVSVMIWPNQCSVVASCWSEWWKQEGIKPANVQRHMRLENLQNECCIQLLSVVSAGLSQWPMMFQRSLWCVNWIGEMQSESRMSTRRIYTLQANECQQLNQKTFIKFSPKIFKIYAEKCSMLSSITFSLLCAENDIG